VALEAKPRAPGKAEGAACVRARKIVKKTPSTKIQAPEKLQIPNRNVEREFVGEAGTAWARLVIGLRQQDSKKGWMIGHAVFARKCKKSADGYPKIEIRNSKQIRNEKRQSWQLQAVKALA
jgi:hypothetical protein